MKWEELKQRIFEETGPNPALDCDIAEALSLVPAEYERAHIQGRKAPYFWNIRDWREPHWCPGYSGQLDVALALLDIDRILPGWSWTLKSGNHFILEAGGEAASQTEESDGRSILIETIGPTAPLAVLRAVGEIMADRENSGYPDARCRDEACQGK